MSDIRRFRPTTREGRGIAMPYQFVEGIMQDDLERAIDTLIGETTATAHMIAWDTGTDFYDTQIPFTITNRSIDLAILEGTYVICMRINGEWRVLWADCGPEDNSGSAGSIESDSAGVLTGGRQGGAGGYGG